MMDFMDHLRRGVDRAGFEVDRLLRANRIRAQIDSTRSQMNEELRQMGRHVIELYDSGEQLPAPLKERCDQIKRYEAEIAQKEVELEAINSEIPPDVEVILPVPPVAPPAPTCPACGHTVHEGAKFCSNCGADLSVPGETKQPDSAPQTTSDADTPPEAPGPVS